MSDVNNISDGSKVLPLSNTTYDVLRQVGLIWLPALGTLYFTLAAIWGLPAAEQVVGTIAALTVFLNVVLGISKASYKKSPDAYNGVIRVIPEDGGESFLPVFNAPLETLTQKDTVTLRVERNSQ